MRTVAIIQARMGSTRLPGKIMMDVGGEPMLARVVHRTSRAATLDQVVVATTQADEDRVVEQLCEDRDWSCFRGSEEDVLDRYYRCAREHGAEAVVRITSDCPLTDPGLVDLVVQEFLRRQPGLDYVSNGLGQATYPRGLNVEVMRFEALRKAWEVATDQPYREHVTLFIYRNPELFELHGMSAKSDHSDQRWTVDTREDLELVRRIYQHFGDDRFSWEQALKAVQAHPDWQEINRHVVQKKA